MNELNEKQLQILAVAERLFAEQGFDGTSVRDIAREAGINIAMVSYYFGSKEKMLEQLICSRSSDMRLRLENLRDEKLDPWAKMDKLIDLYLERVLKNRKIYQIIHYELATRKRDMNFQSFTEVKRRNIDTIRDIIAEGQKSGDFTKDIQVELIPTMIFGTYLQFQNGREFYKEILGFQTEKELDDYSKNELTLYIKKSINALLRNEQA